MNANEIIKALRDAPNYNAGFGTATLEDEAADLIESLQAQLAESQRRERAAVEDLEWLMLRGDSADCCTLCEHDHTHNGPCAGQSTKCEPKWRGPQQAGKGAAHKPGGEQDG